MDGLAELGTAPATPPATNGASVFKGLVTLGIVAIAVPIVVTTVFVGGIIAAVVIYKKKK